jgi:hypothetical protein
LSDRSSAIAVASRTHSSCRDRPIAAARLITMPRQQPVICSFSSPPQLRHAAHHKPALTSTDGILGKRNTDCTTWRLTAAQWSYTELRGYPRIRTAASGPASGRPT